MADNIILDNYVFDLNINGSVIYSKVSFSEMDSPPTNYNPNSFNLALYFNQQPYTENLLPNATNTIDFVYYDSSNNFIGSNQFSFDYNP